MRKKGWTLPLSAFHNSLQYVSASVHLQSYLHRIYISFQGDKVSSPKGDEVGIPECHDNPSCGLLLANEHLMANGLEAIILGHDPISSLEMHFCFLPFSMLHAKSSQQSSVTLSTFILAFHRCEEKRLGTIMPQTRNQIRLALLAIDINIMHARHDRTKP
jgi:hypothetical protein